MEQEARQVVVAVKEVEVSTDLLVLELRETLKQSIESAWKAGKLLSELHKRGMSDQAIVDKLRSGGMDIARSTVNMYRLNYEYYVERYGFDEEWLTKLNVHSLSIIRRTLAQYAVDRDTLEQILKRSIGKSVQESEEIAAKAVGKRREELTSFVNMRVPTPIKDEVVNLKERLQSVVDSVGDKVRISEASALEFAVAVTQAMSQEMLRTLWQQLHGEEEA